MRTDYRALACGRPSRAAPAFRPSAIKTRGGAALFALFFSAKGAGLDPTLAKPPPQSGLANLFCGPFEA